jgi:hypothetical protein
MGSQRLPQLPQGGEGGKSMNDCPFYDSCSKLLSDRRERFLRRARQTLVRNLLEHARATIEDVRGDVWTSVDPKWLSQVPRPLVDAGIMVNTGRVKSERTPSRGRRITSWALASRAAAERWLHENPDYQERKRIRDAARGGSKTIVQPEAPAALAVWPGTIT